MWPLDLAGVVGWGAATEAGGGTSRGKKGWGEGGMGECVCVLGEGVNMNMVLLVTETTYLNISYSIVLPGLRFTHCENNT